MAIYDLKLTTDMFYDLTPRQLDALVKRRRVEIESRELLFGQLTSWIANTGFRTVEKPTTAIDFMPSHWAKEAKKKSPESTFNPAVRMTKKKRQALSSHFNSFLFNLARKV